MTGPTPQTTPTRDEAVRYRKKPVVIEAWQFVLMKDALPHPEWLKQAFLDGAIYYQGGAEPFLTIGTLEGDMRASLGDWIIKGVRGEFYPCKPDIFAATYELASAPSPAGGVDAVAGLSRADICRLWQWAAVNKPSSMTVEGFTDLLLNEIDGRTDPAKVQSITNQYLDILYFADNCLSSNGLFAQANQLRDRLASLSPAATPVSEAGGEADAYLRALLDYSAGFYGAAIEHGMKSGPAADAVQHIERAARNLHRLAVLAKPASSPACGDVVERFDDWIEKLREDVVQDEYGYEEGEFAVYPEMWRSLYDEGLTPSQAFKRALDAHAPASRPPVEKSQGDSQSQCGFPFCSCAKKGVCAHAALSQSTSAGRVGE